MAIFEEVTERGLGLPLGIGLAIAAVSAGPKLVKAGKPFIKGAIKSYFMVQEKAKEMFAETGERLQDLYAEARHEYEQEMQAKPEEHEAEEHMAQEPKPSEGAKRTSHARKTHTEKESEQE